MTQSHNFCGSHEHDISRRSFLGGLSAVGTGLLGTSGAVNTFAADGLNPALIQRFYAGQSTMADRLRILCGKPPVPIRDAMRTLLNPPA